MVFTGICLITHDVAKLAAFYEKVLRVECEGDGTHTRVKVEGSNFFIYSKEASMRDMKFSYPDRHGSGHTTLMFEVEDIDKEFERLNGLGIEFMTKPTGYPWGAKSFHFRDPDGNIVDFVQAGKLQNETLTSLPERIGRYRR